MKNAALVIIDPQTDFVSGFGALPVPGASKDMNNTARFLKSHVMDISCLVVTADEHNLTHISHPDFWTDKNGKNPPCFTVITPNDVKDGTWIPIRKKAFVEYYLKSINDLGKIHIIWPVHCLTNTSGALFVSDVFDEMNFWEKNQKKNAIVIKKGNLWFTEQHSPFSYAYSTKFVNIKEFRVINEYDTIYFAGEAYSHCLKDTVVDCINMGMNPDKIVILKDCTSAISGFDMSDFENKYSGIGVLFLNTGDVK